MSQHPAVSTEPFDRLSELLEIAWGFAQGDRKATTPEERRHYRSRRKAVCETALAEFGKLKAEALMNGAAAGLPQELLFRTLEGAFMAFHRIGSVAGDIEAWAYHDASEHLKNCACFVRGRARANAPTPAAQPGPHAGAAQAPAPQRKGRSTSTRALMADLLQRTPEAVNWTQREVADHIGRSPASVNGAWDIIEYLREREKLERRDRLAARP